MILSADRLEQMLFSFVKCSMQSREEEEKDKTLQLGILLLSRGTTRRHGGRDCSQTGEEVADLTLQSADLGVRVVHAGLDPVVQLDVAQRAERDLAVNLVLLGSAHHLAGDDNADLADAGDVGVEQATLELLAVESGGEGLAGGVDHAVCDADGLGQDAAEANTREDVHVVALAGVVGAGLAGGVGKGAVGEGGAGGEEAAAVGVDDGGLEVTLGLGRGVGEGEDERSGVPVSHLAQNLRGEDATHGGETHQDGGLDVVDDVVEGLVLLAVVVMAGEVDLVVSELVAAVSGDETLGVDEVEAVPGFVLGHAFAHEELDNLTSNADTGAAGTEEHGTVVLAGQTGALDSVDDTAKDDSASTLDVIVEAGVHVTVPLKSREGVLEILELDDNTVEASLVMVAIGRSPERHVRMSHLPRPALGKSSHQLVQELPLLLG